MCALCVLSRSSTKKEGLSKQKKKSKNGSEPDEEALVWDKTKTAGSQDHRKPLVQNRSKTVGWLKKTYDRLMDESLIRLHLHICKNL